MQEKIRYKLDINGQVQGVGFRPHVYRIAKALQLTGFVFNHASGVTIEIQGEQADQFINQLKNTLPPLAKIDSIQTTHLSWCDDEIDFKIIESQKNQKFLTKISADVCICKDCLNELFDSNSRFYLYPFLNCTNCGPRYTIIRDLPYDRCNTTMQPFPLCPSCEEDYRDPENRRYHAQPTACPACGPKLSMPLEQIVQHIVDGKIIALKSLGGYQLICDARNDDVVKRLRKNKQRDAKPFALMALNISSAKQIVDIDKSSENLLLSWNRPIVLLKKNNHKLVAQIAPKLLEYGVMLPYTPLHFLLFYGLADFPKNQDWLTQINPTILVVTSANISGNPLLIDDDQARKELEHIADYVVSYNREILMRTDDSVMRVIDQAPYFIRRSRGFVPASIALNKKIPPVIALGGQLKNTFCITRGSEAFVSQHIGGLDNRETIGFFHETVDHLLKILDVKPEFVVHDLHPNFYTTHFAKTFNIPTISVQHHHAHLASVVAEHRLNEPVIGLALDGYGYGENGSSWGGELMLLEEGKYQRIGHLLELAQPGGDQASKETWRMGASVLYALGLKEKISKFFPLAKNINQILPLLEKNTFSPLTSSCGRLFDAASALLGITTSNQYEGQAAIELESLVTQVVADEKAWDIKNNQLSFLPLMQQLLSLDPVQGANIFHGTLIAGLSQWVRQACQQYKINKVVLSGGCFLNKVLTQGLIESFNKNKITYYLAQQLPPNDGGICLGQVWVAGLGL